MGGNRALMNVKHLKKITAGGFSRSTQVERGKQGAEQGELVISRDALIYVNLVEQRTADRTVLWMFKQEKRRQTDGTMIVRVKT